MKVLQVPFGFYPDTMGGTETYVAALSRHLASYDVQCIITAPGPVTSEYDYEGIKVRRFGVKPGRARLRSLYGGGDEVASLEFRKILEAERPRLIHLHAFTMAASLKLVQEAKRRGSRVLFTYHTPGVTCIQGRLWHEKSGCCDGCLDARRCTQCFARELGLPLFLGSLLNHVPSRAGTLLGNLGLQGGLWTVLRLRELISLRHRAIHSLFHEVDHIIAVCAWAKELILRTGVPPEKITLSRHGLDGPSASRVPSEPQLHFNHNRPLSIAWLGRVHPSKGLALLIQAFRLTPSMDCFLHVYGLVQGVTSQNYLKELCRLAAADARISFHTALEPGQVIPALRQHAVLAVPSQCRETGPLVILEAFAAGIPVIGSALGGVEELVQHGINGLLLDPASVADWAATFQRCAQEPELLARLRSGVRSPRSMVEVAREMALLYRSISGQP